MKRQLLALLFCAIVATFANAEEKTTKYRATPKGAATLQKFGIAGLQPATGVEGQKIRGMGGAAATRGHSFLSGMLLDGNTKSYVFGVDMNGGFANVEQGGLIDYIDPFHQQESNLGLQLDVLNSFNGTILGGAGGSGRAFYSP